MQSSTYALDAPFVLIYGEDGSLLPGVRVKVDGIIVDNMKDLTDLTFRTKHITVVQVREGWSAGTYLVILLGLWYATSCVSCF